MADNPKVTDCKTYVKCSECGKLHEESPSDYVKRVEADMTSRAIEMSLERRVRIYG